jgi:hypothetical protein
MELGGVALHWVALYFALGSSLFTLIWIANRRLPLR